MELEAGEDDTGLTFEGEKEGVGVGVGGDLIAGSERRLSLICRRIFANQDSGVVEGFQDVKINFIFKWCITW